ncbi:surface-associated interspersed protein (SURFIN), partial [Plasmodium relictum]
MSAKKEFRKRKTRNTSTYGLQYDNWKKNVTSQIDFKLNDAYIEKDSDKRRDICEDFNTYADKKKQEFMDEKCDSLNVQGESKYKCSDAWSQIEAHIIDVIKERPGHPCNRTSISKNLNADTIKPIISATTSIDTKNPKSLSLSTFKPPLSPSPVILSQQKSASSPSNVSISTSAPVSASTTIISTLNASILSDHSVSSNIAVGYINNNALNNTNSISPTLPSPVESIDYKNISPTNSVITKPTGTTPGITTTPVIIPLSIGFGSLFGILILLIFLYKCTPIGSWLGNRKSRKKKKQKKRKKIQIHRASRFPEFPYEKLESNMKNLGTYNKTNNFICEITLEKEINVNERYDQKLKENEHKEKIENIEQNERYEREESKKIEHKGKSEKIEVEQNERYGRGESKKIEHKGTNEKIEVEQDEKYERGESKKIEHKEKIEKLVQNEIFGKEKSKENEHKEEIEDVEQDERYGKEESKNIEHKEKVEEHNETYCKEDSSENENKEKSEKIEQNEGNIEAKRNVVGKRKIWKWKTVIEIHMIILEECQKEEWELNRREFLNICLEEFKEKDIYPNVINRDMLVETDQEKITSIFLEEKPLWKIWTEWNSKLIEKWKKEPWFKNLKKEWKKEVNESIELIEKEEMMKGTKKGTINPMLEKQKIIWKKWIQKQNKLHTFDDEELLKQLLVEYETEEEMKKNVEAIYREKIRIDIEEKDKAFKDSNKNELLSRLKIEIHMMVLDECKKEEWIRNKKEFFKICIGELKLQDNSNEKELLEIEEEIMKNITLKKKKEELEKFKKEKCFIELKQEWMNNERKYMEEVNKENLLRVNEERIENPMLQKQKI